MTQHVGPSPFRFNGPGGELALELSGAPGAAHGAMQRVADRRVESSPGGGLAQQLAFGLADAAVVALGLLAVAAEESQDEPVEPGRVPAIERSKRLFVPVTPDPISQEPIRRRRWCWRG